MNKLVFLIVALVFCSIVAADRPDTYVAQSGPGRVSKNYAANFAVWDLNGNSWRHSIGHQINIGQVNGIVAVGSGVLAYGSFTSVSGGPAAGLAYFDGNSWCAPEGVGLYTYTPSLTLSTYDNPTTGTSSAYAAVAEGNDVYLLGNFNQVGLVRDGVAGFVKLTWSNGLFTIGQVGRGYSQQVTGAPTCSFCPRTTQPGSGNKNKLMRYTNGTSSFFVYQQSSPGNLVQWGVDSPAWETITDSNDARNITGNVKDFDIMNGVIYAVGDFEHLNDPDDNKKYLYIASSADRGVSWRRVLSTLPVANFGNLPAILNSTNGNTIRPALTGTGLTSIAVESATSIYVAGGWRVTTRDTNVDNLAGQLQTRIIQLTASGFTLVSERFAGNSFGPAPNFNGPTISDLKLHNGNLYAMGDFTHYRQVYPMQNSRFGNRFTEVMRGFAVRSNGVWTPAFGGGLVSGGDNTPTNLKYAFMGDRVYMTGSIVGTYNVLTGGVSAYNGDKDRNLNNRWHSVVGNNRIVTAANGDNNGLGTSGVVSALHIMDKGNALIMGGRFDWIGSQRFGGIAAFYPASASFGPVGAGLYTYNNEASFHNDVQYNNRIGGLVLDIAERKDYLYAAGVFNGNNTGACLSNIARYRFDRDGEGWESIDGGCDGLIRDILIDGNLLYATGDFEFCGRNPAGFEGKGLLRGNVPTSGIAVVDISKDLDEQSWRALGTGLQGGNGYAMAMKGGDLFVGGTFSSAGGKISTGGIARWNGKHWEDVVAKCRDNCGRDVNVLPYIGTAGVPSSDNRKPGQCRGLREISGDIYCIDTSAGRLAWYSSNTWRRAGVFGVSTGQQNSMIIRNKTESDHIIVSGSGTATGNEDRVVTWDSDDKSFEPSHSGFSVPINAMAGSSILSVSSFVVVALAIIFVFVF